MASVPGLQGAAPRRESVASVLLVAALLIASAIVVIDFSSFRSQNTGTPPPAVTSIQGPPGGAIVIAIGVLPSGTTFNFNVNASIGNPNETFLPFVEVPPLAPVNFTIRAEGSGSPTSSVNVSQPGRIELPRPAGVYLVSTRNGYYNFSAQVPVDSNTVTELRVNVFQSLLQPTFAQVSDPDSTGAIEPWQSVVVQTALTPQVPRAGGTVTLEAAPLTSFCAGPTNSTSGLGITYFVSCGSLAPAPTVVRAAVLQADVRSGSLWLLLSPNQPLSLGGSDLYIYSVAETHAVTFTG